MSAPVWDDRPISSEITLGPDSAPITVYAWEWNRHPGRWAVAVYVGTMPAVTPIHTSGYSEPGHPGQDVAKARGLEALSAWLKQVAEDASAAMAEGSSR